MRVGDVGFVFLPTKVASLFTNSQLQELHDAMRCVDGSAHTSSLFLTIEYPYPSGVNSLKALIEEAWEHGKHVRPSIL